MSKCARRRGRRERAPRLRPNADSLRRPQTHILSLSPYRPCPRTSLQKPPTASARRILGHLAIQTGLHRFKRRRPAVQQAHGPSLRDQPPRSPYVAPAPKSLCKCLNRALQALHLVLPPSGTLPILWVTTDVLCSAGPRNPQWTSSNRSPSQSCPHISPETRGTPFPHPYPHPPTPECHLQRDAKPELAPVRKFMGSAYKRPRQAASFARARVLHLGAFSVSHTSYYLPDLCVLCPGQSHRPSA